MTELEVAKVLALAAPYYQNFKPTKSEMEVLVKAWMRQIGHLDYQIGELAMLDACSRCKQFMPTPADYHESVERLTSREYPTAQEAWGQVLAEVRRGVGYPYEGSFTVNAPQTAITDPLILRAVQAIGGWRFLQLATEDEHVSNRSHFVRCYEQLVTRTHDHNRYLPQVRERVEQLSGPTRIGDVLKRLTEKK